jgi:predicted secreted hydrolase
MSRIRWFLALALVAIVGCSQPATPLPEVAVPSPTPAAGIVFPRDAGPHDGLTEWWYYTGHLSSAEGRAYGFEFTIFQVRRQDAPTGYLAHFAVSDVEGHRFSHQMRFVQAPAANDLPLDVGGWKLGRDGSMETIEAAMEPGPGADPAFSLNLRVMDEKPPALHHGGYIDYGPAGGSYYYSRTRLSVSGALDGLAVSGVAWMDHQWGNFVVSAVGGWDWYSLQLDDQTELMLYVLRSATGEPTGMYGTRVLRDGSVQQLSPGSVLSEPVGSWTSPHTGAVYPSGWLVTLPGGERLNLQPQLVDQELWFPSAAGDTGAGGLAYWEGAVTVGGDRGGLGYVELTGYAR